MATRSFRPPSALGRFADPAEGAFGRAPGWVRAALSGLEAAVVGAVLTCLPFVVIWLASPSVDAPVGTVASIGLSAWALGHGVPALSVIGPVSLIPLLLTALLIWVASWPAARLASRLDRGEDPPRLDWLGSLRRDVAAQGAVFVLAYGVAGVLGCLLARSPDVSPALPWAALTFPLVGLIAYVRGLAVEFRSDLGDVAPGWRVHVAFPVEEPGGAERPERPARSGAVDEARIWVPAWVWVGVGAGLRVLRLLVVVGAVVVVAVLVARGGRVVDLYGELSPGLLGGAALTAVQLLYLPTFAIWGLSWMTGAGFGVGVGSSVTITQSTPGLLPLVPVFGALPDPGALPWWTWLFLAVPLCGGALIERRVTAVVGPDPLDRALAAAVGCVSGALGATALGLLASGALGSGRLATVGVPAWLMGALLGGELALGASLALGARLARGSRSTRPARSGDARSGDAVRSGDARPGGSRSAATRPGGSRSDGPARSAATRPGGSRSDGPARPVGEDV